MPSITVTIPSDVAQRLQNLESGIKKGFIIGDSIGPITADSISNDGDDALLNLSGYNIQNSQINHVLHSNANYNTLWYKNQSGSDRAASCEIIFSSGTIGELGAYEPGSNQLRIFMSKAALTSEVGKTFYLKAAWA